MKKTALLFPGQGAQCVGMGNGLTELPHAQEIIRKTEDILGFDLMALCMNGPEEELTRTENSQAALYTCGYIAYKALNGAMPTDWKPEFVAGLSLGELTALAVAGVYSFEDGLRLVRQRGQFMMQACEDHPGGMASIMGAERDAVATILQPYQQQGKVITMANLNCPGQIVISGEKDAVSSAAADAENAGYRAVMLNVSGAFHSPLMESARVKLSDVVSNMTFNDAQIPVVCNVDAQIRVKGSEIKESLIRQIVGSVLWEDSVRKMIDNEVTLFAELGCGKVLKGLIRRIDRSVPCNTVENSDNIEAIRSLLYQEVS